MAGTLIPIVRSDNPYVMSLAATAFVAGSLGFGSLLGGWQQSKITQWIASYMPLTLYAAVLGISDLSGDLGEADQFAGTFAVTLLIGGIAASPGLWIRQHHVRIALCVIPHSIVATGLTLALASMPAGVR